MKGNKKFLVIALLLLLVVVSFGTYAIYKSSATGTGSVNAAAWVVKVKSGSQSQADIVSSNTFTLDDIAWDTTNRIGQNGTIAPGDHGTVAITIDASGSEVGVSYAITLGTLAAQNNNLTVTAHEGSSLTGTIAYGATMTQTVTLDVVWNGVDDDTVGGANDKDIALQGTSINIPVTVTVTQNPNLAP